VVTIQIFIVLGNLFDPDVFNIDRINGRLRQYASGDREWLFATTIILG
jgi:hypothetical protein